MAVDTPSQFVARLTAFEKYLTDDSAAHLLGKMAKDEARDAASADLGGDPKFSGWAPKLDTRYDIVGPGRVSFKPTSRGAGPWTVAEFGRNQSAGPRLIGPRLTPTGRVSRRRVKRWNGRTQPKHTATEALGNIDKQMTPTAQRHVTKSIAIFFR